MGKVDKLKNKSNKEFGILSKKITLSFFQDLDSEIEAKKNKNTDLNPKKIFELDQLIFDRKNNSLRLNINPNLHERQIVERLTKIVDKWNYELLIEIDSWEKLTLKKLTPTILKLVDLLEEAKFNSQRGRLTFKEKSKKRDLAEPDELNRLIKNFSEIKLISNDSKKETNSSPAFLRSEINLKYRILCRYLQDLPPNILSPEKFVEIIAKWVDYLKKDKNLSSEEINLEVMDQKTAKRENMNLYLSVANGSRVPPLVLLIKYLPDSHNFFVNSNKKITGLVGKGITFDSGGYSKKLPDYLIEMKYDMSGAAIISTATLAAAELGIKKPVLAISLLTENTITRKASLPDTVVTSKSGLTVEIENTDAEGRLVLADGITLAKERGVNEIIEVSSLTGAIITSLGHHFSGAFSQSENLFRKFDLASKKANEDIWRLPLIDEHLEAMKKSPIADLKNMHPRKLGANSSHAGAFLQWFAKKTPFIHLDVAGSAWKSGEGKAPMVKTIIQFLKDEENKQ